MWGELIWNRDFACGPLQLCLAPKWFYSDGNFMWKKKRSFNDKIFKTFIAGLIEMLPLFWNNWKSNATAQSLIPDICVNFGYSSVFGHRLEHK